MHPPQLAAVLFDLDDTLLDHRGAARDAVLDLAVEYRLSGSSPELEERWRLLELEHYRRYQLGELSKEEQRRRRVRSFLASEYLTDEEADAVFARYWSSYAHAWRPFSDAVPALRRAINAGLVIGVLTNGDWTDQSRKIEATGLTVLCGRVFASSELVAAKPDRRAFWSAASALGADPERCLMVGDSLENDVIGARDAGMPAVLLDRYGRHPQEHERRIASLDDLRFDAPECV